MYKFINLIGLLMTCVSLNVAQPIVTNTVANCSAYQTEWITANLTKFEKPLVDVNTSYVFLDTPSFKANDTCMCSQMMETFTYWQTNGTWVANDTATNGCSLQCDRCLVYFCLSYNDTTQIQNVTIDNTGNMTCRNDVPLVTTTTDSSPTETIDDFTVNVDVEVMHNNYTYNYTYEYPVPGNVANF